MGECWEAMVLFSRGIGAMKLTKEELLWWQTRSLYYEKLYLQATIREMENYRDENKKWLKNLQNRWVFKSSKHEIYAENHVKWYDEKIKKLKKEIEEIDKYLDNLKKWKLQRSK